jgi:hypothetical protein
LQADHISSHHLTAAAASGWLLIRCLPVPSPISISWRVSRRQKNKLGRVKLSPFFSHVFFPHKITYPPVIKRDFLEFPPFSSVIF